MVVMEVLVKLHLSQARQLPEQVVEVEVATIQEVRQEQQLLAEGLVELKMPDTEMQIMELIIKVVAVVHIQTKLSLEVVEMEEVESSYYVT
jgi:hypothetical protein